MRGCTATWRRIAGRCADCPAIADWRRICPPGAAALSSSMTRTPRSAAARLAARPAGPAPTTATTGSVMATARIGIAGRDHVSIPGVGHARAHDRRAVDPDQTVEALADAAVDRTRAPEPAGAAETAHA